MTAHFSSLVLQQKSGGVKLVLLAQTPRLSEMQGR
jgi:hypothetical protein